MREQRGQYLLFALHPMTQFSNSRNENLAQLKHFLRRRVEYLDAGFRNQDIVLDATSAETFKIDSLLATITASRTQTSFANNLC